MQTNLDPTHPTVRSVMVALLKKYWRGAVRHRVAADDLLQDMNLLWVKVDRAVVGEWFNRDSRVFAAWKRAAENHLVDVLRRTTVRKCTQTWTDLEFVDELTPGRDDHAVDLSGADAEVAQVVTKVLHGDTFREAVGDRSQRETTRVRNKVKSWAHGALRA